MGKFLDSTGITHLWEKAKSAFSLSGHKHTTSDITDIATVAKTGKYSDLSGTPTIPTNNNQLTNGAGYQTASDVTKAVSSAVGKITSFDAQVVTALPTTGTKGVIYLIADSHSDSNDSYDEYIWLEDKEVFEKVGNTDVDLSQYVTTSNMNTALKGYLPTSTNYAGSSSVGGAATSAVKATQDSDGNQINTTYLKKADTVAVSHGGTGATTLASGQALIGNGTGAVSTRAIKDITTNSALGWTSGDNSLIDANTLAYWNGAYSGTSSNIAYCNKGAFGDIVTHNANEFITSHYSSKNVVGTTTATTNSTSALGNGYVYLNSVENNAVTSSHKITGSGATSVTTDTSGNIVISSTDTNTTYSALKNPNSLTVQGNGTTSFSYDGSAAKTLNIKAGSNVTVTPDTSGNITIASSYTNTDTKNTAGATDTSSKIFLVGATAQEANPQTYSQDTAYVGTDGCLYSGGAKVLTSHQSLAHTHSLTIGSSTKSVSLNGSQSWSLSEIGAAAASHTHSAATSSALGMVKVGSNITNTSGTISLTKANVTSALGYTPPTTDTKYTLPVATTSTLGGVKVGDLLTINSEGVLSTDFESDPICNLTIGSKTATALGITYDDVAGASGTVFTLTSATTSIAGLMSAADKSKLDGLSAPTKETWTFTLEDGSTVSKTVRLG